GGVLCALAIAGQATMAVGRPLGGLLIAVGGWRLTFLVNVPLAAAGIAAVLAWLPAEAQRVRVARAGHELDPPGLVLFAAGLSAPDAGLLMVPSFVVTAVVSALATCHSRVWQLLVAGAAALAAGSAGLLLLTGHSPLWLLLAISVVFGAQNGLNVVANQTAMYGQAPADSIGTAAGMLRTFMYLGAIASASLISLSFGHAATDAGLHRLAVILTVAAAALLAVTLADRRPATARQPARRGRTRRSAHHEAHQARVSGRLPHQLGRHGDGRRRHRR